MEVRILPDSCARIGLSIDVFLGNGQCGMANNGFEAVSAAFATSTDDGFNEWSRMKDDREMTRSSGGL